mmetsp:Transcript_5644/g.13726  ORF Transcript_5644/g.13726 Transcript_5644/m.13726 type:complete len:170 (+) Transcript_5644:1-510(+)
MSGVVFSSLVHHTHSKLAAASRAADVMIPRHHRHACGAKHRRGGCQSHHNHPTTPSVGSVGSKQNSSRRDSSERNSARRMLDDSMAMGMSAINLASRLDLVEELGFDEPVSQGLDTRAIMARPKTEQSRRSGKGGRETVPFHLANAIAMRRPATADADGKFPWNWSNGT